ncbi:unnamed protein product [Microthlaspi erraticum]|uniref:CCHC-type domain-containing protein n=1 Tax=Microthlaspi erraticum TaxID=1685480 RepID=A0A6D2I630_9BRAS|nr:unnamed protein product [Microthlaspi erraticum]
MMQMSVRRFSLRSVVQRSLAGRGEPVQNDSSSSSSATESDWGPSDDTKTELDSESVTLSLENNGQSEAIESRHTSPEQRELVNQATNPMLTMMHDMLTYLKDERQAATNGTSGSSTSPDFLKIVTMMKNLGSTHYGGGTNPFDADSWLQNLEKNFAATRCPEDYKKDVSVYYLEKDAASWWSTIEHYYNNPEATWQEFRKEFTRKYFPPETRDRLEAQFLRLEQGKRSVRNYKVEFTRLRRYVKYGQDDEAAITRRFMHGLRPEIQSRLQVVEYISYLELVGRAVNVEAAVIAEEEVKSQNRKRRYDGDTQGEPNNQEKRRENRDGQMSAPSGSATKCYTCGEAGHIARQCPSRHQYRQQVPPHIICHSCGEKGHYSNFCRKLELNQILALDDPPPRPAPVRPVIEEPAPAPVRLPGQGFPSYIS